MNFFKLDFIYRFLLNSLLPVRSLAIILVITALSSVPGFTQDHLALQKEAEAYFNKEDIDNALAIGESALNFAELNVGKAHIDYADILCDVAVYNAYAGNYEKAISQMEESLDVFRKLKGEKSKEYSEAQEQYGTVLYFSGDYARAEGYLQKATEMNKYFYGSDSKEYAISLTNLALVQQMGLKKASEAEKTLLISKSILEKRNMQDSVDYAVLLNNLGSVYQDEGDYLKAEQFYKDAAKADRKNGRDKTLSYSTYFQNFGTLYMDMGRYDDAKPMILKDVEMKKKLAGEDSPEYASALNNLGEYYSNIGNFSEAEKYLILSLKIKEKKIGIEHHDYLTGQSNLASVYYNLGRKEEAYTIMKKIMITVTPEKISNPADYAFFASNFAFQLLNDDKLEEAEKVYKEVLDIYKEQYGETYGEYTEALSDLSVAYLKDNNKKLAKEILIKAIDIARKEGKYDSKENIDMLNNLAGIYQAEDNLPKAEEIMRDVVRAAKEYYGEKNSKYNFFLFNLGLYVDQQAKNAEAEQIYSNVIETDFFNIEHSFAYMSEAEKGAYYATFTTHFDAFFRFALVSYKANPAILSKVLNYRLATKAMLLNSSNKTRNAILSSKDSRLIDNYLKWKSEKDYLVKLYSLGKRDLALMKVNVDSIELSVNAMEKQLSQKINLTGKTFDYNVSWKQVQNALGPEETAVEMIRAYSPYITEVDKVFYIALIIDKNTKDYPKIAVMDDGYEMETRYCKEYRNAIADTTKKESTYQHFWEKIENELGNTSKVYFSADGIYPKINLNSVRNPNTHSYLIDKYDFYFVSSLRDLIGKKNEIQKVQEEKTISLFGYPDYTTDVVADTSSEAPLTADYLLERKKDNASQSFYLDPLPGTKKEVEGIAKMMKAKGWKTDMYLSKEAQEQKLKSLVNPTILHIATHGYFQNDVNQAFTPATSKLSEKMAKNPLLCSGLMLAGASNAYNVNYAKATNWTGKEDGILTAYEAMNLNLDKTELVVLSACETGLGEIHNGEGVYGLQRAFMVAGAKTVIMSLWSVSDEATQKLMTLFYSKWLETGDKHGAFRYAQMELKKTFPDPYFWSAFVMIGN